MSRQEPGPVTPRPGCCRTCRNRIHHYTHAHPGSDAPGNGNKKQPVDKKTGAGINPGASRPVRDSDQTERTAAVPDLINTLIFLEETRFSRSQLRNLDKYTQVAPIASVTKDTQLQSRERRARASEDKSSIWPRWRRMQPMFSNSLSMRLTTTRVVPNSRASSS